MKQQNEMKSHYDLEVLFNLYLKKSGLPKDQLSDLLLSETRRAFYGGVGQTLLICLDSIDSLKNTKETITILDSMLTQVTDFWEKELEIS